MRTSKNKSTLKNVFFEGVKPTENTESKIVADGGALLWLCNWSKGEKFRKIFALYIDKCRKFNINTFVFDWCNKSTKDAAHKKRSNKMSQVVEISDGNVCPSDRAEFLKNFTNKQKVCQFIGTQVRTSWF